MKNYLLKITFILFVFILTSCSSGSGSSSSGGGTSPAVVMDSSSGGVADGESHASLTPNIVLLFSTPMNPDSVNTNTVFLTTTPILQNNANLKVDNTIPIESLIPNDNNTRFYTRPTAPLFLNTKYYLTITSDAKDINGNSLSPITFSFTTVNNNNLGWSRQVGAYAGYAVGMSISNDGNGNSYITGYTTVGLSGKSQQGENDYFIATYSESGALLWTRQVGGKGGNTFAYGISTDNDGNSYITGSTDVAIFGKPQYGNGNYFIASFISKYSESGTLFWTKQIGESSGRIISRGISTDSNGNKYVAGSTNVALSGESQQGNNDYFISKYSESGILLWTRQVGGKGGNTFAYGISTDNNGNSYVTGYTNIGLSGEVQRGGDDSFIAKYSENGKLLWTRQVGATGSGGMVGNTLGSGISTDSNGNSYVTGYTTVGLSGKPQHGYWDYFIVKYSESGTLLWTRQVGASGGVTQGYGISTSNDGDSYITGTTTLGLSGELQQGDNSYFIAKYSGSGELLWTKQVGSGDDGETYGYGISTDSKGNSYITGSTNIGLSGESQQGDNDYFIAKYGY